MQDTGGGLANVQNAYDYTTLRRPVYLNATSTLERRFRAVYVVECRPMTVSVGINMWRFQTFKAQVVDIANLLESLRFRLIT